MGSLSSYLPPTHHHYVASTGEQEVSAHRAGGGWGGQEDSVTEACLPLTLRDESQNHTASLVRTRREHHTESQ